MKLPGYHWLVKYKLYHIPLWCLYHYAWWTVAVANPMKAAISILSPAYSVKYLFYVLFEAAAVYFNLYYLMPRFFKKGRYPVYIVLLAFVIAATSLCIVAGYYLSSAVTGRSLHDLYGDGSNCFFYFLGYALPSAFASMTLAMTVKLWKNKITEERRQQQIEKEKTESELKFLKAQFNPHFLFNSINSIFVLIRRSPERASSALAMFSDLLRHQLYDCNDRQIPLGREIGHLKNFVELEKLRQNEGLTVDTSWNVPGAERFGIAPFILMTFVENAFKHVARDGERPSRIVIDLTLSGNSLRFVAANSKGGSAAGAGGGIGLQNVQRTLQLVYPNCHELRVSMLPDWYEVRLELRLHELVRVPPMELTS